MSSEIFRNNLIRLGHTGTVEIIQEDSQQAATRFPDGSIDLVFVDGDHSYEAVKRDLQAWLPKVTKGGILSGHDFTTRMGVYRAVDEMFGARVALPGGSIWVVRKTS